MNYGAELGSFAKIKVLGVGGGGGNAINRMIKENLQGVEFIAVNADAQALFFSEAPYQIRIGDKLTKGLGAGGDPEIGAKAAEESKEELQKAVEDADMIFITAGIGGGTGTGASPLIAQLARQSGALTIGVVTKPFQFEGMHRMRLADKGIDELEQYVDTLIIIPNQNLFRVANEKTTFADAFKMADDVLYSGVRGVTDLMVMPGLINLDFADVRSVMSEMGKAMMGTGEAAGERRALDAAEAAISNPLLDDSSMAGANGVLINISGGSDMTLFEVDEAANRIRSEVDEDAYIIFGSTFDESLDGRMRVSVVATGIEADRVRRPEPAILAVPVEAVAAKPVPAEPRAISPLEATVAQALAEKPSMPEEPIDEPVMHDAGEAEVADDADDASGHDVMNFSVAAERTDDAAELAEIEAEDEPVVEAAAVPTPASMPSLLNDDAYIPSAPAARQTQGEAHIDPMAEAALLNGGEVAAKPKGLSLFERVTGGAKNKVAMFGPAKTEPQAPAAAPYEPKISSGPAPKPAMRSTGGGQAMLEPTLGGLDPQERLQNSPAEDDLLDIPAFLRRQAN